MLGKGARTGIQVARDGAEPGRSLVAEPHEVAGHQAQAPVIFLDLLRQRGKNVLQRARFGPHRDDRAGELLRFLPAGPAEHQPDEAHQGQRAGEDRDPLRDQRAGKRLVGQRAACGPGGVAGPQQRQHRQRPAEHHPPAGARDFMLVARFGPAQLVELRFWLEPFTKPGSFPRRLKGADRFARGAG